MKRIFTLSFIALALTFSISCNKQYNEAPIDSDGIWTWSGTPPFSAKLNGNAFVTDKNRVTYITKENSNNLKFGFTVFDVSGTGILLAVAGTGEPKSGDIFEFPGSAICTITVPSDAPVIAVSTSGKVKVISNDEEYITGMFYSTTSTANTNVEQRDTVIDVKEGYFRIKKK